MLVGVRAVFIPVIFLLGFLGVILWATSRPNRQPESNESPLEIAKRRYARGEISGEEYDRLRADLR